jgi:hypothetical protein
MMNIKIYNPIFGIVAFLLLCCIVIVKDTDLGHNITSNIDWIHKKNELKNTSISKIIFYSSNGKEVALINSEKDAFIESLVSSKFYKSNWQGMVDTDNVIFIIYNDGSRESLEDCGGGVFQIDYKGRMFSIKNNIVEQNLLKDNLTH